MLKKRLQAMEEIEEDDEGLFGDEEMAQNDESESSSESDD